MRALNINLVTVLLEALLVSYVTGQCYLNPSISTAPGDERLYRTDELDLQTMTISILEFISIIRSEYWAAYGQNLTLTAPLDGSCAILGDGLSLETFTRKNNWEIHLTSIPVLTDVVRLSANKFYIPSQSKSVLLNMTQFQSLTQQLNLILDLKEDGPPQLSIYKNEDTGDLILETFNAKKTNVCVMGHIATNIWHAFENTLQLVDRIWAKMGTILRFYGADPLIQHLGTCLNVRNVSLESLLNTPSKSFKFCLQSFDNSSEPRVTRPVVISVRRWAAVI